jgi:EAL domain-containing protein (putative c-di-GMP-specific phosphodiesterase class I)
MGSAHELSESKPGRRVLVVDDEDCVRQFMSLMIGSWGYEVATSSNVQPSDLSQFGRSDLIFVDMMMPEKDGIQVLDSLSRSGVKSSIVLMSGTHVEVLATAERIARQQGLHVAGLLRKPFRARDLRRLLEEEPPAPRQAERRHKPSEINVEDLLVGLERHEFDTYLQPIVELATGRVAAYEALARWNSEKFSLVSPDRFIQVAARNGILPRLTQQIANRALDHACAFGQRGLPSRVSINIGVEDLADRTLPERLMDLVAAHGLPSRSLIVELTESSATSNEVKMLEVLARIRLKGIDLAIDDFGTSYSSLERLSIFPFTMLKIDVRFVHEIVANPNARTIVQSSLNLARRLNLKTVAEGIENQDQLRILKNLGCAWGQGYVFAPPMEFSDAMRWAVEHQATAE